MTWHHINTHTDHQQGWDILICHRQTSAGKLRPVSATIRLFLARSAQALEGTGHFCWWFPPGDVLEAEE